MLGEMVPAPLAGDSVQRMESLVFLVEAEKPMGGPPATAKGG